MFGDGVAGELRCAIARFARLSAAPAAAATPAPAAAVAFAGTARRIADRFRFAARRTGLLDRAIEGFALRLVFGLHFGGGIEHVLVRFERGGHLRLRRGQGLGGLDGMNLIAAVDDIRLLRVHRGVGGNRDGDAEALFQRAQVAALVVEHIERHF